MNGPSPNTRRTISVGARRSQPVVCDRIGIAPVGFEWFWIDRKSRGTPPRLLTGRSLTIAELGEFRLGRIRHLIEGLLGCKVPGDGVPEDRSYRFADLSVEWIRWSSGKELPLLLHQCVIVVRLLVLRLDLRVVIGRLESDARAGNRPVGLHRRLTNKFEEEERGILVLRRCRNSEGTTVEIADIALARLGVRQDSPL